MADRFGRSTTRMGSPSETGSGIFVWVRRDNINRAARVLGARR